MKYRMSEVAEVLGVSTDTVRRWVDAERLPAVRTKAGHREVEGTALAKFVVESRDQADESWRHRLSARNRFPGIVTAVNSNEVSATVEIQAGPHRLVSLHTAEAVKELGLKPGMRAVAVVKATNVIVEGAP